MALQKGFGAEVSEPSKNSGNPLLDGTRIFRVSHHSGKNRVNVVLLDDQPIVAYRHKLNTYPMGKGTPMQARDIRITCASPDSSEPTPRNCILCEAMLRHNEIIKRTFTASLSLVSEEQFTSKKGVHYQDLKYILELDYSYFRVFAEQRKAAPGGSLVGMRFSVMRPEGDPQRTKTFGDSWTPLGIVDPVTHFWKSAAVPRMIEYAKAKGRQLDWPQAVAEMTAVVDYDKEVDNYDAKMAEMLVMFAVAKDYTASGADKGFGSGSAGAPPPMPAGQVPNYATAPQQAPQPQQPQQAPQQAPQQGYAASVPAAQQAPQYAPPQAAMAPPQAPPQVANPPQATAPQQTMQAPPIDGYNFDQMAGWQGQPQPQPQAPQQAPPQPQQAPQGMPNVPTFDRPPF